MPGIDGPVCLTHTAPDHAYQGHLLFYDVVPPSVVSRSGVLSSVVETGGDALLRLPGTVTLSEFRAWINTDTGGEQMTRCTDMAHACDVLKAVDALDDPFFSQWLQLTARILHTAAIAHYDRVQSCNDPQHSSDAISKLPDHLQHRVFEAVPGVSGASNDSQEFLLRFLPSKHHAALLAATITPGKGLVVPQHSPLDAVVEALKVMPASTSPLLSLRLESKVPSLRWGRDFCDGNQIWGKAATGIAAALRHHSNLTSLQLSSSRFSTSMFQPIASAIATLTSLRVLHLGSTCKGAEVQAVPLLKPALQLLPSLQDLKLSVTAGGMIANIARKRGREGAAVTAEPQHCLSSVLRSATALTSLHIEETLGDRHFVASSAISMPFLRQLEVASNYHNISSALLPQLSAPLEGLELTQDATASWERSDIERCRQLWGSLCKFVQLRSLVINLDVVAEVGNDDAIQHHVLWAVMAGAPAAIASLPSLQELSIRAALPVLIQTFDMLPDGAAGVQRLQWRCTPKVTSTDEESPTIITSHADWRVLMRCMSRLQLQHLDMCIDRASCRVGPPGMAPLQPLTGLTALHVSGWRRCLKRLADCEALAGMQQLRSVCVDGFVVPADLQADCVRTLGAMPALAQLALMPAGAGSEFQAALAHHAPQGAWPELQWLGLGVSSRAAAAAVVRAVAAFPALLKLSLRCSAWCPLSEIPNSTRERLTRQASEAGVSVAFEWDWKHFKWTSAWA